MGQMGLRFPLGCYVVWGSGEDRDEGGWVIGYTKSMGHKPMLKVKSINRGVQCWGVASGFKRKDEPLWLKEKRQSCW